MTSRSEGELAVDYSERAGFLVGKAAAIADWRFRREEEEFERLIARLKGKKRRATDAYRKMMRICNARWRQKYPGKRAAYYAEWAKKNRSRINERRRRQHAARRAAALLARQMRGDAPPIGEGGGR